MKDFLEDVVGDEDQHYLLKIHALENLNRLKAEYLSQLLKYGNVLQDKKDGSVIKLEDLK